jgi:tripartite-type tricarboxylate transporter receptor subunit TctC
VLATPAVRGRLAALGATPIGGAPQVFQKMIDDDYHNWGKVIRAAGILPE